MCDHAETLDITGVFKLFGNLDKMRVLFCTHPLIEMTVQVSILKKYLLNFHPYTVPMNPRVVL